MEKDKKGVTFQKILDKALRFLSIRPRSRKEILIYLGKKIRQNQLIIDKVLSELENLGLVDDYDFACWWVEQRITFRPKGKKALIFELRQKGIDPEIIEKVINQKVDEVALAKIVAEKKLRILKNLSPTELRSKLEGFLARRGFRWETIKKVLDQVELGT